MISSYIERVMEQLITVLHHIASLWFDTITFPDDGGLAPWALALAAFVLFVVLLAAMGLVAAVSLVLGCIWQILKLVRL